MRRFTLLLVLLAFSVLAQDGVRPDLEGNISIFKLNEKNEYEPLGDENKVKPGEVLRYEIEYVNKGNDTATDVEFEHPVPSGMEYIPESAEGGEVLFSIDQGETYQTPPVKYEIEVNGIMEEKIATPSMYTNIKWIYDKDIEVDESAIVKFTAKVKEGEK